MLKIIKMSTHYRDLINSLISESIIIPEIKFISFTPAEIERYNELDEFYVIRKAEDLRKFSLSDMIKTEWR